MKMKKTDKTYDVLVIGGGIAGQEAALNLADMNHKVLLVEKGLSIGGKMIQLSKVFPTLDCAACITTPKMSETARHPNITLMLNSEIESIAKNGDDFEVDITKKPRYVISELCTGCQLCEFVCPQIVDDQYNYNMVGRKAIYIPFNLANPKIATIDIDNCIHCKRCVKVCAPKAIDFEQKEEKVNIVAKSVVVTTGYQLFPPAGKPEYGYTKYPNVIDSMQMDRLIAPTRPYNNVLRPGDGKIPDNIAYVLCTGSRDSSIENSSCSVECSNNPICSQICCMYSIKQAQLLMGALPMADITIYYMDIRAFGKGYEEFFQQSKSMGVNFVKGKVAKIRENENNSGDLILRYEDVAKGVVKEAKHDLVILSVGVVPNKGIPSMFKNEKLELDEFNFVKQTDELVSPAMTSIDGVFVAGAACGPKDIPDSILSAGCAATEVAGYLNRKESGH
jgi:heterodisulfide reductase subunit A